MSALPSPFTVATSRATAPISYTWKRGSTVIATTSVPSYTINSATLDDAGSWSVTITNPAGPIDSASVTLVVAPFAPGQIDYSLVPLAFYDVGAVNAYGVAQGRDGEVFVIGSWSPAFSFNMSTQGTFASARMAAPTPASTPTAACSTAMLPTRCSRCPTAP